MAKVISKAGNTPTVTLTGYVDPPSIKVRTTMDGVRGTYEVMMADVKELAPRYAVWVDRTGRLHRTNYKVNYSGATSVDLYNTQNQDYVQYVYSPNSRVIRGTEDFLAVRLKSGVKGWLNPNGVFISQDGVASLMRGLDGTLASGLYDFSFEDLWDKMSARQRMIFTDSIKDIDWDTIWKEVYDPDAPLAKSWAETVRIIARLLLDAVVG